MQAARRGRRAAVVPARRRNPREQPRRHVARLHRVQVRQPRLGVKRHPAAPLLGLTVLVLCAHVLLGEVTRVHVEVRGVERAQPGVRSGVGGFVAVERVAKRENAALVHVPVQVHVKTQPAFIRVVHRHSHHRVDHGLLRRVRVVVVPVQVLAQRVLPKVPPERAVGVEHRDEFEHEPFSQRRRPRVVRPQQKLEYPAHHVVTGLLPGVHPRGDDEHGPVERRRSRGGDSRRRDGGVVVVALGNAPGGGHREHVHVPALEGSREGLPPDVHALAKRKVGREPGVDGVQRGDAIAVRKGKGKGKVRRLGGFDIVPEGPPELAVVRLPVGHRLVASRVLGAGRVLTVHGPVVVLENLPLLDVVHHRERQRLPRRVAFDAKVEPRSVLRGVVATLAVAPGPQLERAVGAVLLNPPQVTAVEVRAHRVLA
mmetsp:Transcript_7268/g.33202  ORF Transcript_7268/g.33202 Transcript_7268/m.33202 type:complete len:426 (+) Transcript_7268:334-1611(+)